MTLAAENRIRRKHTAARFQFVLTELDLAVTFAQMALATEDHLKTERNRENAERAFSAAQHFVRKASFSRAMKAEIHPRLVRIKRLLRQVDEGLRRRFVVHI